MLHEIRQYRYIIELKICYAMCVCAVNFTAKVDFMWLFLEVAVISLWTNCIQSWDLLTSAR